MAFLEQQQAHFTELASARHRHPRILPRPDQNEFLGKQRNLFQRRFRHRKRDDCHVQPGFQEVLDQFLCHRFARTRFQSRIMPGERLDDLR
ncbi:hypothetical protein D3C87_1615850 [compost metagenome]